MKCAHFHPAVRPILREFPEEVRKEVGKAIFDLQRGERLAMPLSRPMRSVGVGVEEIRLKDQFGIYRVFCYLKSARGVLVFHAFMKKGQKTPRREIELGKKRLREVLYEKA